MHHRVLQAEAESIMCSLNINKIIPVAKRNSVLKCFLKPQQLNQKKQKKKEIYLQKALDILEQVEATVTAVILKRNATVRAFHLIGTEVSR